MRTIKNAESLDFKVTPREIEDFFKTYIQNTPEWEYGAIGQEDVFTEYKKYLDTNNKQHHYGYARNHYKSVWIQEASNTTNKEDMEDTIASIKEQVAEMSELECWYELEVLLAPNFN